MNGAVDGWRGRWMEGRMVVRVVMVKMMDDCDEEIHVKEEE